MFAALTTIFISYFFFFFIFRPWQRDFMRKIHSQMCPCGLFIWIHVLDRAEMCSNVRVHFFRPSLCQQRLTANYSKKKKNVFYPIVSLAAVTLFHKLPFVHLTFVPLSNKCRHFITFLSPSWSWMISTMFYVPGCMQHFFFYFSANKSLFSYWRFNISVISTFTWQISTVSMR